MLGYRAVRPLLSVLLLLLRVILIHGWDPG